MSSSDKASPASTRLVAHDFSLYSGKARAYLRYKQIPFVESSTPEDREMIKERVGRRVIPVVFTADDDCVQDTTVIIDLLANTSLYLEMSRRSGTSCRMRSGCFNGLLISISH